jgi:hypothetical protein
MRHTAAVVLGVVAFAVFAVPEAAQRAMPRPDRAVPRGDSAVPFAVGETLTYDVAWSSFLLAGTAVSTVRERRPGRGGSAYHIVAEGRPVPLVARLYSLYYKMETLVDTSTLLPQEGTLYSEEGRRQRLGTTRFDREARKAFFELRTETTVRTDLRIPPRTQDGLSALYSLRANPITAGTKLSMPVIDDGALYNVTMQASGAERVQVPLGEMTAWNMRVQITDEGGQPVGQNIGVWISNDARRLPVKIQAELPVGTFGLALREAK